MAISTVKGKTKSFSNPQKIIEKLWKYTVIVDSTLNGKPTQCWEYPKRETHDGYGRIMIDKKEWRVNKLSHHLFKGKIPSYPDTEEWRAELWILHRCNNRKCYRPSHLQAGLPRDNTKHMLEANRAANKYASYLGKSEEFSRLGSPTKTTLGELASEIEKERATDKFQATGRYSKGLTSYLNHGIPEFTKEEMDRIQRNLDLLKTIGKLGELEELKLAPYIPWYFAYESVV